MAMIAENRDERLRAAYAREPDPIYPDAFRWPGIKPLPVANIASDLAPCASSYVREGSRLYVVGYDCPNLIHYELWKDFLVNISKMGCSITYFLGKNSSQAADRLREIAAESNARQKQIQLFAHRRKGGMLAESYARQWKSFHFAIFEEPRQLWIEMNHPEGDTRAYNCYYLPPDIAKDELLLDVYKSRFDQVIEECATLEFES